MPSRRASARGRGRRAPAEPTLAPSGAVRSHASRARRHRAASVVRAATKFGHLTGTSFPYGSACCSVGLRTSNYRCCY